MIPITIHNQNLSKCTEEYNRHSIASPIEASGGAETHLIERREGAWAELLRL